MNLIVFLDALSRTILGEAVQDKSSAEKLAVKNPVILDIVPNPESNQLQLRMIPIIFREFQAAKDDEVVWFFNRNNITENQGFELEFRIKAQYQQMFSNLILPQNAGNITPSVPRSSGKAAGDVIKLFDD